VSFTRGACSNVPNAKLQGIRRHFRGSPFQNTHNGSVFYLSLCLTRPDKVAGDE
jgi:hypothetical protein